MSASHGFHQESSSRIEYALAVRLLTSIINNVDTLYITEALRDRQPDNRHLVKVGLISAHVYVSDSAVEVVGVRLLVLKLIATPIEAVDAGCYTEVPLVLAVRIVHHYVFLLGSEGS